jgi:hypothetical protein
MQCMVEHPGIARMFLISQNRKSWCGQRNSKAMTEKTQSALETLSYPLVDGFVHNWLVAGPYALPVDLAQFHGAEIKQQIVGQYSQQQPPFTGAPAEQTGFTVQDAQGEHPFTWRAVTCLDDHFVDLTGFYHTCHYLCAWAYAEIEMPAAGEVQFRLTTNGPAQLWLNDQFVHRQTEFSEQSPYSRSLSATLQAGRNRLLICFENAATRACPYVMALHVKHADTTSLRLALPSAMPLPARRQKLETLFSAAYLTQDVYHREDEITLHWPADAQGAGEISVRLQTPGGRIYVEAHPFVRPGAVVKLGKAYQVPEGAYQIVLMPPLTEYYEHGLRIQRRLTLHIANGKYTQTPYGVHEQRRQEALDDAARRNLNIYSEIAKMALGRWAQLKIDVLEKCIDNINRRADCSDFYLAGLLGMLVRFGSHESFPAALKPKLETCILNFKYWMDEPGSDTMCYWTENHQILFHACEVLAGQCYPDALFSNNGKTGAWHRAKGEQRALAWLNKRAMGGFREWDSNCYFEEDVLALSHLADLAENTEVAELAAVVLDKLFFTLAINSHRGVFGSTHGRTYASLIKGGRLESTAGLARLLWGLGVFNSKIMGVVSLACARNYQLPPIIAQIATAVPEELWSRERHAGKLEPDYDCADGVWEVNKVTYKTPDYMLCSAQDYLPGEPGRQQHIWQATFDPDAVVFVNHPPCLSEDNAHRPNFWHGNAILPRLAQWKDVLVAVYKLPEEDWLGFTHAYFPLHAFDEYALREGWAFVRKREGYLALTASCGLQLVTTGQSAHRELRSYGRHNVWFAHMGRAAQDGAFADFQSKVLELDLSFEQLSVHATTLRGESIDFGWEGPLLVNEDEQPLHGFKHYDSPFSVTELGAKQMEIQFLDQLMRLDFSA